MEPLGAALAIGLCCSGLAMAVAGAAAARSAPDSDAEEFLRNYDRDDLDDEDADDFSRRLKEPFISRVLRPIGGRAFESVIRLTPRDHIQRVHANLLHAGLSGTIRAEEFVTIQVISVVAGVVVALFVVAFTSLSAGKVVLVALLCVMFGALLPQGWLNRKVQERRDQLLRDLPDVLDLMAIAVEAGVGFEGAMETVCSNFDSPLAEEFSRTLKEMELGLPRREALQNLKKRTEVPDLSNFVLALTQADALGMPIGRVLQTQATEMRSKRRQWAREKAGKLPVKILFPLVLFIFPAVFVVILGPAGATIVKNFR